MSDYRSEASSRSAVKTELTSAHLECLPISLASGLFVAAVWMQTTGTALLVAERRSIGRLRTPAQGSRSVHGLLYLAAVRDDWCR
jgi:hypothetical protein